MRICVLFPAAERPEACKINSDGMRRRCLRQHLSSTAIHWRGRLQFKAAIICVVPPALDRSSRVRIANQYR
jgi:hypothetical protein